MTARRRSRSEAFLLRLPSAVLEFPFEVLIAVVGIVIGLGVVTGLLEPNSIATLLPEVGRLAWGSGIGVGGVTLAVGLARRAPGATSSGLRLVGILFMAYGVALLGVAGIASAGVVALLFLSIGGLCLLRALYLHVSARMRARVVEEA